MDPLDDKLNALWAEYRDACPDPDPAPDFTPRLWQRIQKRRTDSARIFRRLAQVCVMATLALALLMGAVLIPRIQTEAFFAVNYADELAAQNINADYTDFLAAGDLR
jgi:hypothetical protein